MIKLLETHTYKWMSRGSNRNYSIRPNNYGIFVILAETCGRIYFHYILIFFLIKNVKRG